MSTVLIATDADEVFDEVDAALAGPDTTIARVHTGEAVLPAVKELDPDLVVLDLQIGNMGGMATCMDLRLEEGAGRVAPLRILMLLDRLPDVFLAQRCRCRRVAHQAARRPPPAPGGRRHHGRRDLHRRPGELTPRGLAS